MSNEDQLLIGLATRDITPPLGVDLAGYGPRQGGATEVGHSLRAEALVCRSREAAWALVTSDVIGYPRDMVARVRQRIAAQTDLSPEQVCISATHTHSGPSAMRTYRADLARADHAYREELEERLAHVVGEAAARLQPGSFEVAWAKAPELGHNRRLVHEDGTATNEWEDVDGAHPGPFDATVLLVGVRRPDGRRAALLVNYGCHPVTLGPQSLAISADYVGYLKDHVESRDLADTTLFALAGGANINPRVCIHVGAEYPRRMGEELGRIVCAAAEHMAPVGAGPVASSQQAWTFTARNDGPENTGRRKDQPFDTEVMALRAGDLALVCVPGELFNEYNARFRAMSPFAATAVVSLANDSVGYIVTDEVVAQGALEGRRACCERPEAGLQEQVRAALDGVTG